ncbi:DUF2062 domain-containing protein [Sphingosinicella sp. BN140058]|uniref:DUF2062 domain-containing protein n=1 Tax=Sphingosinicella sp. BN140058 TaxID=1892855 RepID=UPI0013EB33E0|nr:DUF2062 domain-containing protein [Sphingosinicella sp. BN140058]
MAERSRLARWASENMPRREDLAESRWIKPFGQRVLHSEFWRFTRRSVPRGVAVGLLVGIFLMIPGLQIVGAALMCVPVRGNIPLAALMTFLSNPLTTPFFLLAAIFVGNTMGFRADTGTFWSMYEHHAGVGAWLRWLLSDAAPSLITGLFVIAAVCAVIGYFLSIGIWRWWQVRKWRRRARRFMPEI